jgi:DNA polymerase IV
MVFNPQTISTSWIRPHRPRTVVHLNIADFAVAVERQIDHRLKEHPVIIAPEGSVRAVVYDMSEEAFRVGVRKHMPLRKAKQCCRDALILPPHPDRYERAMQDLLKEVLPYSPLIEPGEVDGHVFIDTTGTSRLFGPPIDVAWRMYRNIKSCLGFAPIWAVAPNKLVSKVATRIVKPLGEYIVGEGEEAAFLAPLPISLVPGIETDDLIRMRELNLSLVRQVANLTLDQLTIPFGKRAGVVFDAVRGIDPSPVLAAGQKPPKIMADHEFGNDTNDVEVIESVVYQLVEKIGVQLRKQRKAAQTLAMMLDHSDGVRRFRQMSVRPPSANDIILFKTARSILYLAWTRRVRMRHIRLICSKPIFPPAQMELFPDQDIPKQDALIAAMDRIRERFGRDIVHMGRAIAS